MVKGKCRGIFSHSLPGLLKGTVEEVPRGLFSGFGIGQHDILHIPVPLNMLIAPAKKRLIQLNLIVKMANVES